MVSIKHTIPKPQMKGTKSGQYKGSAEKWVKVGENKKRAENEGWRRDVSSYVISTKWVKQMLRLQARKFRKGKPPSGNPLFATPLDPLRLFHISCFRRSRVGLQKRRRKAQKEASK